jgi:LuxR family maltose regulon positive regulatory protein
MVVQAVVLHAGREKDRALQVLGDALALAEPGGFIRLFLDEGEPMRSLMLDYRRLAGQQSRDRVLQQGAYGYRFAYVDKLLSAFETPVAIAPSKPPPGAGVTASEIVEPLSQRELEVLQLIAQGLSNGEISQRLFLALNTVKGHNRIIFDKLQVQNRTEAVARARELGLL